MVFSSVNRWLHTSWPSSSLPFAISFIQLEASSCFRLTFSISFSICVLHVIYGLLLFFFPFNLNSNVFCKTSPFLSSQNMIILSHSISFCHLIYCLIQSQHISLSVLFLFIIFTPYIALTIALSILCKIVSSFSFKHHVLLS